MSTKPSMGRVVIYTPTPNNSFGGYGPFPAIVRDVHADETTVDLTAFGPHSNPIVNGVPYEASGPAPGCWSWPVRS